MALKFLPIGKKVDFPTRLCGRRISEDAAEIVMVGECRRSM